MSTWENHFSHICKQKSKYQVSPQKNGYYIVLGARPNLDASCLVLQLDLVVSETCVHHMEYIYVHGIYTSKRALAKRLAVKHSRFSRACL